MHRVVGYFRQHILNHFIICCTIFGSACEPKRKSRLNEFSRPISTVIILACCTDNHIHEEMRKFAEHNLYFLLQVHWLPFSFVWRFWWFHTRDNRRNLFRLNKEAVYYLNQGKQYGVNASTLSCLAHCHILPACNTRSSHTQLTEKLCTSILACAASLASLNSPVEPMITAKNPVSSKLSISLSGLLWVLLSFILRLYLPYCAAARHRFCLLLF